MNGLSHIQEAETPKENLPLGLPEGGGGNAAATQLLRPEGISCPELWNKAQALFDGATKEQDPKEHHRKLMEAGFAFVDVVLATGHHPIEKSFALNNLGLIMQCLDHMDKAQAAFSFALTMNPDHPTILQNYATVRMVLGDLKDASNWFYKALERDPKCAEARWNSALIALTFGDFRRGFLNYEWRWRCGAFTWRRLKTSKPQWNGQSLKGKTILLTHEQGFGDSVQFIRYAKMVKALGPAKVRYLCVPELICILKDVEGIDEVTEFKDVNRDGTAADEDFDYHCPLLSLPRIFKTRVETVPWDGPYVRSPNGVGAKFDGFNVGVVWAGRRSHANDKNRSMELAQWGPLLSTPGVNWYSLQFGEKAEEAKTWNSSINHWEDGIRGFIWTPTIRDFTDTAFLITKLDLVICVDTVVAHLAGAMGRPVWTLLPHSADWRWMQDREDTPWYPTMRLFRQKTKGDWAEVIERVRKELWAKLQQK